MASMDSESTSGSMTAGPDERFEIQQIKLRGPRYRVRVFDTRLGEEVPLGRGTVGGIIVVGGRGSAARAVRYGTRRYLRYPRSADQHGSPMSADERDGQAAASTRRVRRGMLAYGLATTIVIGSILAIFDFRYPLVTAASLMGLAVVWAGVFFVIARVGRIREKVDPRG